MSFQPSEVDPAVLVSTRVFVRALKIDAEIGIYEHEHGRRQPLIADVELVLTPHPIETIADTVNYEVVVAKGREIAASGHFKLVETFAETLARALLADPRIQRATVRVEKPQALAPAAEAAGVEVVLERP